MSNFTKAIIPYQEIIGNYSALLSREERMKIIPYQEIIGNYSRIRFELHSTILYHTKK